jgi:hypothetical protein
MLNVAIFLSGPCLDGMRGCDGANGRTQAMSRQKPEWASSESNYRTGLALGDALRPFPPVCDVGCEKLGASPRGFRVLGTTCSWKSGGPTVGGPHFDDGKRVASK